MLVLPRPVVFAALWLARVGAAPNVSSACEPVVAAALPSVADDPAWAGLIDELLGLQPVATVVGAGGLACSGVLLMPSQLLFPARCFDDAAGGASIAHALLQGAPTGGSAFGCVRARVAIGAVHPHPDGGAVVVSIEPTRPWLAPLAKALRLRLDPRAPEPGTLLLALWADGASGRLVRAIAPARADSRALGGDGAGVTIDVRARVLVSVGAPFAAMQARPPQEASASASTAASTGVAVAALAPWLLSQLERPRPHRPRAPTSAPQLDATWAPCRAARLLRLCALSARDVRALRARGKGAHLPVADAAGSVQLTPVWQVRFGSTGKGGLSCLGVGSSDSLRDKYADIPLDYELLASERCAHGCEDEDVRSLTQPPPPGESSLPRALLARSAPAGAAGAAPLLEQLAAELRNGSRATLNVLVIGASVSAMFASACARRCELPAGEPVADVAARLARRGRYPGRDYLARFLAHARAAYPLARIEAFTRAYGGMAAVTPAACPADWLFSRGAFSGGALPDLVVLEFALTTGSPQELGNLESVVRSLTRVRIPTLLLNLPSWCDRGLGHSLCQRQLFAREQFRTGLGKRHVPETRDVQLDEIARRYGQGACSVHSALQPLLAPNASRACGGWVAARTRASRWASCKPGAAPRTSGPAEAVLDAVWLTTDGMHPRQDGKHGVLYTTIIGDVLAHALDPRMLRTSADTAGGGGHDNASWDARHVWSAGLGPATVNGGHPACKRADSRVGAVGARPLPRARTTASAGVSARAPRRRHLDDVGEAAERHLARRLAQDSADSAMPPPLYKPHSAVSDTTMRCYGLAGGKWWKVLVPGGANAAPSSGGGTRGPGWHMPADELVFDKARAAWVPSGKTAGKKKPGLTSVHAGDSVRLQLDTTLDGERGESRSARVLITYLQSYEYAGAAELACASGCTCAPFRLLTLAPHHKFAVMNHSVMPGVSQSRHCELVLTNASPPGAGEPACPDTPCTKVKLIALAVQRPGEHRQSSE